MSPSICQKVFFGLHHLVGSDLEKYYREFLELSQSSGERVRAVQSQRLEQLLIHAAHRVPFYRRRVNPGDGLDCFPIVTKDDLRIYFQQFKTADLSWDSRHRRVGRGYSWTEVRSGGTTGIPVTVIHDREFRDRGRASRLFSKSLCGFSYGVPFYYLLGSMAELQDQSESLAKRLDQGLSGMHPLNAFRLDEASSRAYLRQMVSAPRSHLMAYVDAAESLVRFALRHQLPLPHFQSVMACAGTVFEDNRRLLRESLGATIHNKYGSRECTDMVCENTSGELLVYANHVLLEVVDDRGLPVAEGQPGRILVTLLGNKSFPLIRYEIGDMAVQGRAEARTSPFPTLLGIEGRISDFITSTQGDFVSPVVIRHLVGVVHGHPALEKYQFIQYPDARYELKIQLDPVIGTSTLKDLHQGLIRDLLPILGPAARFEVSRTEKLEPAAGGKFRYVINHCRESL